MEEMDVEKLNDDDESQDFIQSENRNSDDDEGDKISRGEDDEDSSGDEEESEDRNEKEVHRLETVLQENPYDYASHLALVALLRKMGELERLRKARDNMSSYYPLSPEIWLEWIKDEINLASTPEQKQEVVRICELAVQDYLSIEVWLEYLQFSIGNMGTDKNAAENVRRLFSRALVAGGLSVTKGAIIWESFREFESILIQTVDKSNDAERKKQIDRVANLFQRQLSCPLLNMEKTFEEFQAWRKEEGAESSIDDSMVKSQYERAYVKLNARLPYEEKILSAQTDNEILEAYNEYLVYEKANGDPGRVTVLYERAVASISLEASLWLQYVIYIEDNLKIQDISEQLYRRAVRNVPWCGKIWQMWMRSYEQWDKPLLDVQHLLERGLAAGFQTAEEYRNLWLCYLEYLRRRLDKLSEEEMEKSLDILRNIFNKACDHLAKLFGMEGDPNCVILQYWARTEAIHARDMEKARSLWTDILSQGHSSMAASWLEYISLERCYGDTKHLRKLFQKALTSVKDWPESIANSWLDFERDEGTLEQMKLCENKTKERLDKVAEERSKSQQYFSYEPSTSSTSNLQQGKKAHKRKMGDEGRWQNLELSPQKVLKLDILKVENKKEETSVSKSKVAPPPGFKGNLEEEKMEEDQQQLNRCDVHDIITVFISNLDYSATEEDVREALKSVGPITLFKMIKDFKGRSKGFCYVQLSSEEAVEQALKLDRTPVGGRPMFISRCNPNKDSRESGFKYSCDLEKNKLFVKGLAVTTTKEQIEEFFAVYGALKEVRLVTYRNGHSKGIAYVEFKDESHAKKALLATDGTKFDGKIISVAISKPPQRKKNEETELTAPIKSLGGSGTSRTAFGVPKTVLSMIPRNVKPPSAKIVDTTGNGSKQPMSNEDFRNMLLGKK